MNTILKTSLTPQEKQQYAQQYAGLVKHIACRMAISLPEHLEVDDLINDGVVGLMDALNRFDPSKGIKFQTFAATRIRGAILDALRALDWASRGARKRNRELQGAEEKLSHSLGRQPTAEELAQFAGITVEEVRRRRKEHSCSHLVSLDAQRSRTQDDSEDRLADYLPDDSAQVDEAVHKAHVRGMIRRGLETLSEREQLILSLYYFEELNIREIGYIIGVSEARISQIHSRCLKKLREYLAPRLHDSVPRRKPA